ncbi:HAMP domain-containing sensor histidine kinase [Acidocella sp.]|uniref:sensor histidine kinase n=1 Tax=Acidocella sp. TaxID=50710 RepID=UPI002619D559|nr:HAMP domain-containing sensor histidine kinase [Acidocella sp.]
MARQAAIVASGHKRKALFRSAGVRFALVYAAVFGLSAFVLAIALWYSTLGLLQRQVQNTIHSDSQALLEHEALGGLPALEAAIHDRLANDSDPDGIYLLMSASGQLLAGNLDHWPAGLERDNVWYELPVNRQGVSSIALLQVKPLPGGDKLLVGRDVRARLKLRNVLRAGLIWAASLMIALGVLGALLIRSLFRRTIRDIAATTSAIAKGDISRRVPVSGIGDEFDELAITINDMLDRIARLMDGVRQVSNAIAHDLRTPVTRARTKLEDASLHARSEDELRAAIERAIQDLDGIVSVFDALLRISEIEAGSRRAAFAPIDLSSVLIDLDELYRAVAEEKQIVLHTEIAKPLMVLADRDLIQQAVVNLLENALKFSDSMTVINFSASVADGIVQIVVADRGPGIAEKDRARATERFFRGEAARSTAGSGLGLALVMAVTQLHNGTLHLHENHPGLRAVISLPAYKPQKGK